MSQPTFAEVPVDEAAEGLRRHLLGRPFPFSVEADLIGVPDTPGVIRENAHIPIPVLVLEVPARVDRKTLPRAWPDTVTGHPVIARVKPEPAALHDPQAPAVPREGAKRPFWRGRAR